MAHLAFVSVLVPDYDAGLAFFVGQMGFGLIEDTDLGGGKRWIRLSPPTGRDAQTAQTQILLARAATPEQCSAIGQQGGGRVWLFLATDDFEADHSRYLAAGVAFEEPPRHEPYGTVAVFRDPFGNRWDLIQFR
ncbi:MAG: VOC family protein [Paracoccaceae bacterium]